MKSLHIPMGVRRVLFRTLNTDRGNVKKEELSTKLLEFLESPHPTTDTLLADKEQKGKKRKGKATTSRIASSGEASEEALVK
ncbi:Cyclase-like protein 4 [Camellia lanceoleosa]|uniref:Cyclase-like protein 4 n=1 Tax=Camellia lanceoleosa TaxID=1840588 RepID=A0ACC0FXI7_9ERIC|nr:Cyclase-like protein 4 [Camellia lanceoleosa]